jgi:flagellar basal body-associated protein FliL
LKEQKQNINKMFKSVKIILLVFILIFALVFGVYSFLIYQKDKGAQNEQIFNKACLEKEKFSNNLFFKKQIEEKLNCLSLEQKNRTVVYNWI